MMTFHSILFAEPAGSNLALAEEAPDCFADLNLDQIVGTVTAGRAQYELEPFFYTPLTSLDDIHYRHEVMVDLDADGTLLETIRSFARQMIVVRRYVDLVGKLQFKEHREGWFLEAVEAYCEAISSLANGLDATEPRSRGLSAFRRYVTSYARSPGFTTLAAEARALREALSTVRYAVLIKDNAVRVRRYQGEIDQSAEVLNTFEKFKQGAAKDYSVQLNKTSGMNHVEARILSCVARLYPDVFASLEAFCARHHHFLDETVTRFDREIQFYVAYLDTIAPLRRAGLPFCYPELTTTDKNVYNTDGFDLALAAKLVPEREPVIGNDFFLEGSERIIVVSGPNQGGKTTFARAFGQLHYLASLGCLVPGREARLFLFDRLFTHFEREENIENLRGKLQDDLVRMHAILDQATPDSVIVINEIFTSTTASDAAFLGQEVMARIIELDALCICVTFIDELASMSDKTASMVSTVYPDNPAQRTFKIIRQPADGLAYALSIAEKYRLTYSQLKDRLPS